MITNPYFCYAVFTLAGLFSTSTKERLDEVEDQKAERGSGIEKKHIIFFLHQFVGMDYTDINCQKLYLHLTIQEMIVQSH